MPAPRALAAIAAAAALLAAAGCGNDGPNGRPALKVSAAASLKNAFEGYGGSFAAAEPRFSFAASNELAAQIRSGGRPDVFAAADAELANALYKEGLVGNPVVFAANRLVIAVPAGSSKVHSLRGLAKPGVRIAVAAKSAPAGVYAANMLAALDAPLRTAIAANIRSTEPDVNGVIGKLSEGAVDAALVYVTDVRGAGGRLEAVRLPARLPQRAVYAAVVVKGGAQPMAARVFVKGLLGSDGRRALAAAGFLPPPGR